MKKRNKRIITFLCGILSVILIVSSVFGLAELLQKPVFSLNGEEEILCEIYKEYTDPGVTVRVGNRDLTDKLTVSNEVNTDVIGAYKVCYSLEYKNKIYSIERLVNVIDTEKPELTLVGEAEINIAKEENYNELGVTIKDNYDSELEYSSEKTPFEDGFKIEYSCADSSGNVAKITRLVHIRDCNGPRLTINGAENMTVSVGDKYVEKGCKAIDDGDGDISDKIIITGTVDTSKAGKYTVNYSCTDSAGNTSNVTREVTVKAPAKTVPQDGNSVICLTFDDGPSSNITPQILDTLKANGVKATFFIINYSDSNKSIVKRITAEGHTIAIHGYSHDYGKIYASESAFMNNITTLRDKIKNDTGVDTKIMRFPGGSSNTVSKKYCKGIMSALVNRVTAEGYTYVDWNVSSGDAESNTVAASKILNSVKSGLKKGRTNVVLMHDCSSKSTTAAVLQSIIDYGKANGYTFSNITANTPTVHHGVNN